MRYRRRNSIETVLINLTKNEGADQVHIGNDSKVFREVAECPDTHALASLPFAIFCKYRIDCDARGGAWNSLEKHSPRRASLREVFTRKQRIGTAIDRPEKRFAHTCALGRRSGCKGRNKESGRSVAVACRQSDVRKV